MTAPGSFVGATERWSKADVLLRSLPETSLVVADARVLRLHPRLAKAIKVPLVKLTAGEGAKSLSVVEKVARAAQHLPRSGTLVALGGGTIGDVATVCAHLIKRGVRLVQLPSTLLAAVDSSLGGKGAVNVGGVKNALGVFHAAAECWLCPELFETLSPAQLREGRLEAWKMVLTLDAASWRRWSRHEPSLKTVVTTSRALKDAVCSVDPYERRGVRVVLNFGHTFGHVLESVSKYALTHGEAVGLGMLCALDVGVALGVTPRALRDEVEAVLPNGARPRARMAAVFNKATDAQLQKLLAADKKSDGKTVRMVLVPKPGRWVAQDVPTEVWRSCLKVWRQARLDG